MNLHPVVPRGNPGYAEYVKFRDYFAKNGAGMRY
jgi:hypothetical protein